MEGAARVCFAFGGVAVDRGGEPVVEPWAPSVQRRGPATRRDRGKVEACLQRQEGTEKESQEMGRSGQKRDVEPRSGTHAEEMVDRPGPKSTSPEEKRGDPMLQDVVRAATASRVALEGKIYALVTDLTVLRDNHRRLAEKVATTDRQLKELLPEVKDDTTKAQQMEKQIRGLELRAEDAENRSRRNNIRVIGKMAQAILLSSQAEDSVEIYEEAVPNAYRANLMYRGR
ncbi:hypothetical protein NDU88_002602 [Pleurodeles waltl]|uniref:Uncharacterized protein n=1 Tax=Pleurodeles waltl TaxID=8319 RepID=A0AAV7M2Z5_PLEWA|nr:hypothetical protein NDU88_002602 [Pleurodeles waltl]